MLFPQKGVRFIAVNDNVDSASEGMDNDFTPLRKSVQRMAGERYEQENQGSEKVKRHERQACYQQAGLRLCDGRGRKFYYRRGSRTRWCKQIYQLCLAGNGPTKIARMLTEQQIPTPGTLEYQRTGSTRRYHPGYECKWATNTVVHILENREYTGCLVNFKTEKPSYKVKHSIENPVEKQAIFENHHEPIIDKETWERVQELRKQRKRPNRYDEVGLFSGILFCADCGHVLYQQRYQNERPQTGLLHLRQLQEAHPQLYGALYPHRSVDRWCPGKSPASDRTTQPSMRARFVKLLDPAERDRRQAKDRRSHQAA